MLPSRMTSAFTGVEMDYRKALRTAQSYAPALKPAKDAFYRHARRILRRPHEPDFGILSALRRDAAEVLVDVGANHGQSIESMRLFQPRAPIVAFEANPRLADILARRYAGQANVRIEGCGLGDSEGAFTLFVPSYRGFVYDGLASVDRDNAAGWLGPATIYGFDERQLVLQSVACKLATLDAFQLSPAFIKVDVQGLEFAVLGGARATIERCRPALLIEDFGSDPRIAPLVKSLGYDVFHVEGRTIVKGTGPRENTLLLPSDRPRFAM